MAGMIETFGAGIESRTAGLAASLSEALIESLLPVLAPALVLWLAVRDFRLLAGKERPGDFAGDLVIDGLKVGLAGWLALSSAGYVQYVIPAVEGMETLLVGAVTDALGAGDVTAWSAVDALWLNCWNIFSGTWEAASQLDWVDLILVGIFMIGLIFVTIFMILSAASILLGCEVGLLILPPLYATNLGKHEPCLKGCCFRPSS